MRTIRADFHTALLALAFAPLALLGCGDESAGTTTEATNGIVVASGVVARLDGTPAHGALVRLIDDEHWLERVSEGLSPTLDSAFADADGKFELRGKTGRANVQADDGDQAALLRLDSAGGEGLEVKLDTASTLAGSVPREGTSGSRFLLSGTAYAAELADGEYGFGKVAKGNYAIVAALGDGEEETLRSVASVGVKAAAQERNFENLDTAKVMVDDFDDEEDLTTLGRIIGAGWRYHGTDAPSKASRELVSEGAWSGRSLRAKFSLAAADTLAWGTVGLFFGDYGESFDLTGLEAVEFRAKGHGLFEFSLFSEALNEDPDNDDHFALDFALDSADGWRAVRIGVDELRLRADTPDKRPDGYPISEALKKVGAVRFVLRRASGNAPGDYALSLDDVVLVGVPLERFAR